MARRHSGSRALGAWLAYLRSILGLNQARLARRARVSRASMSEYEAGKVRPIPETRARLAGALWVPVPLLHLGEALTRSIRALMSSLAHAVEPGAEDSAEAEVASGAAGRAAESYVRLLLAASLPELRALSTPAPAAPSPSAPEDREAAPRLWALLEPLTLDQQRACIAELPELQSWALADLLGSMSTQAGADDAARAVELAELGLWVFFHISGDPAWRARVQGRCLEYLGNARRIQGDLAGADEAFAHARRLWPASEPDPSGLLAKERSFSLEASLRSEQGRFAEALDLLGRASAACQDELLISGLLIKKAGVLEFSGDDAASLAVLREAAPLVSREANPRQYFALHFNLATTLAHLGRHAEAAPAVPEIQALAEQSGKRLDIVRSRWLAGRVAAGLGRVEEAVAALEEVRAELAARDIAFDTAQVSVELAALYLEAGKTARVRELAEEAVAVFERQASHHEALAALHLFLAAVEKDRATAALAHRLATYLRRAQHDRALRFDG